MGCVAFLTFGIKPSLCTDSWPMPSLDATLNQSDHYTRIYRDNVLIYGFIYDYASVAQRLQDRGAIALTADWHNMDITTLFRPSPDKCQRFTMNANYTCSVPNQFVGSPPLKPLPGRPCPDYTWLDGLRPVGRAYFSWDDVERNRGGRHTLLVFNGAVLNLTAHFGTPLGSRLTDQHPQVDQLLERALGYDGTKLISSRSDSLDVVNCLRQRYVMGYVDSQSIGCTATLAIQTGCLVVILAVLAARFLMAVAFHWFIAPRLVRDRRKHWFAPPDKVPLATPQIATPLEIGIRQEGENANVSRPSIALGQAGRRRALADDPYTILFVTCYSEGEDAVRNTLEGLASTNYPDSRKLLFVIADGLVTGKDNSKSTPDAILGMMVEHDDLVNPQPKSYLAIASGPMQHNMARVHAGYYYHACGGVVPMITVVKCGTPAEASDPSQKKAGNRGKRDSQLVLMNFLSRVMFDDWMTPLDYELAWKIKQITNGINADRYQLVLMVDADTKVASESLYYMVQAMKNDDSIMGLCGETRIANKRASWVTAIQVFEYYISHHLGKSFESVFGGVTCLPGCFCMYRIKTGKGPMQAWTVPILANPDIVEEYSENVVDTLHKKNLLLLGEDRFLTTLMLRTFPKRQIYVLPVYLMLATLGLPGFLIVITTRKLGYLLWMFVYILAIPIWNFIFPLYAFWNFDDFSWGETRRIEGESSDNGLAGGTGVNVHGAVALKKWADWEAERQGAMLCRQSLTRRSAPRRFSTVSLGASDATLASTFRKEIPIAQGTVVAGSDPKNKIGNTDSNNSHLQSFSSRLPSLSDAYGTVRSSVIALSTIGSYVGRSVIGLGNSIYESSQQISNTLATETVAITPSHFEGREMVPPEQDHNQHKDQAFEINAQILTKDLSHSQIERKPSPTSVNSETNASFCISTSSGSTSSSSLQRELRRMELRQPRGPRPLLPSNLSDVDAKNMIKELVKGPTLPATLQPTRTVQSLKADLSIVRPATINSFKGSVRDERDKLNRESGQLPVWRYERQPTESFLTSRDGTSTGKIIQRATSASSTLPAPNVVRITHDRDDILRLDGWSDEMSGQHEHLQDLSGLKDGPDR
ncbi:hypothetical protein HDU76_002267 [Blyttiomyces sp. JEL0837]|nr:hypothetical protein HDU76_002267 [Blyttiomyces sp. JEL0837]